MSRVVKEVWATLRVKLEFSVSHEYLNVPKPLNSSFTGLTRALASEVGRQGIRVNVIVPGYIESDMTAGMFSSLCMSSGGTIPHHCLRSAPRFILMYSLAMTPDGRLKAIESIPLGRFGDASEVADAALFLATNKYANNCVLNLDGGLSAT